MSTLVIAPPTRTADAAVAPVIEMAQIVIEEREAELDILRERLAYYEAFDSLINENVARAAELFRSVSDERERLHAEALQWRAETESRIVNEVEMRLAEERRQTQTVLVSLMDEATSMQRQIDGLIQRLSEAITRSNVRLPHDCRS